MPEINSIKTNCEPNKTHCWMWPMGHQLMASVLYMLSPGSPTTLWNVVLLSPDNPEEKTEAQRG